MRTDTNLHAARHNLTFESMMTLETIDEAIDYRTNGHRG